MSRWGAALRFIGIGWYLGCCILIGILGGQWLDTRFDSSPILVIIGLLSGLFLAFFGTWRMLLPLIRKNKKEDE